MKQAAAQGRDEAKKEKMATQFNNHHRATSLPPLRPGDVVRVRTDGDKHWSKQTASVEKRLGERRYLICYGGVRYYRNRRHLKLLPTSQSTVGRPVPAARAPADHRQDQQAQLPTEADDQLDYPVIYPVRQPPSGAERRVFSPRVTRSGRVFCQT